MALTFPGAHLKDGIPGNDQGPTDTNRAAAPEISLAALPAVAALLGGAALLMSHRRKPADNRG
ncbi:MAG TPA: hypothetical protein VGI81_03040 [Tepidisphaeraceae bacterium]